MGFEAELQWEGQRRRAGKNLADGAEGRGRQEIGLQNGDDHGGDHIQFGNSILADVGKVGRQVEAAHDVHRYAEPQGADVDPSDLGDKEHWCGNKTANGIGTGLAFVGDGVLGGEVVVGQVHSFG